MKSLLSVPTAVDARRPVIVQVRLGGRPEETCRLCCLLLGPDRVHAGTAGEGGTYAALFLNAQRKGGGDSG